MYVSRPHKNWVLFLLFSCVYRIYALFHQSLEDEDMVPLVQLFLWTNYLFVSIFCHLGWILVN